MEGSILNYTSAAVAALSLLKFKPILSFEPLEPLSFAVPNLRSVFSLEDVLIVLVKSSFSSVFLPLPNYKSVFSFELPL